MAEPERVATTTPTTSNQDDPNFINSLLSRRNKDRIDKLLLQSPTLDTKKPPQHSPRRDSGHNHPYRHVSTPNPRLSDSKSRSRNRKDSTENRSRKKSLEKISTDIDLDNKSEPEKPHHTNRTRHSSRARDPPQDQKSTENKSMENGEEFKKNTSVFHILSKNQTDNIANTSSPIDSPDSDENNGNFESAENSPLNNTLVNIGEFGSATDKDKYITGIAEQTIDNVIIQSAVDAEKILYELANESVEKQSDSKSSEKIENSMENIPKSSEKSAESSKNRTESTENTNIHAQASGNVFPSFVSGYNTLPLPASVTTRILNFRTDAQNTTSSEDETLKTKQTGNSSISDQVRMFTGQKPTGSTGAIAKTTPEQPPKRKRTLERPTIIEINNGEPEKMETNAAEGGFKTPKKFATNFVKVMREKVVRSIKLQNKYHVLTDTDSDDEASIPSKKPDAQKPTTSKPRETEAQRSNKCIFRQRKLIISVKG
ncbi:unnamed protein product [Psylliodes chrysocephalus]|uniref:Uncharacterized protein n=1 Tax=Psylliodes chrysocephalus TaxID=3402493 RepID=A0A9P0CUD9_9CUCU|nr:unnamed protein product [Psylliodes chrysocephala]